MNRIILIGNGFDLAHGLKTSYNDFLDDYWKMVISNIDSYTQNYETDDVILKNVTGFNDLEKNYDNLKKHIKRNLDNNKNSVFKNEQIDISIKFKNKFLEIISDNQSLKNWVDIEGEYYELLKEIFEKRDVKSYTYNVSDLNKDFSRIIQLLREYLIKIEQEYVEENTKVSELNKKIASIIYSEFKLDDFPFIVKEELLENELKRIELFVRKHQTDLDNSYSDTTKYQLYNDILNSNNQKEKLEKILNNKQMLPFFNIYPKEDLLLNFNYISTENKYLNNYNLLSLRNNNDVNMETIHIHGSLNENDNNPIIFGYGDELDDDYAAIEKLNDNQYLENIKSIKYSETDNYKRLLEYINSDKYQVFIFGHSCGLSDRTLLNTLFEHENCVSIKPFYHQWEDKDGNINDNYSDLVRNISRNFNDKTSMRDKVVNKTYCEQLLPL